MQIVPSASGTGYELKALTPALKQRTLSDVESARLNKTYGNTWDPKTCLTCGKKGEFRTRLADDSIVTCACTCIEQRLLHRLLLGAGIGETYQRYSWNHLKTVPQDVLDVVLEYLESLENLVRAGVGMILWSERTGTGKTLLATLILKEVIAQGHDAYFTSFRDMLDQHTAAWSDSGTRAWFVRRIQNAGYLFIDDLGKENVGRSSIVDELLDGVIRHRIAHNRPTGITTNLKPSIGEDASEVGDDFRRYKAGLLDLLRERSLMIEVKGVGYRDKQAQRVLEDALSGIRYPVVIR